VAAHGRRIAAGDVERLRDLVDLATEVDHATATAVTWSTDRRLLLDRDRAATRYHPPCCATTMGQCGPSRSFSDREDRGMSVRWILPGTGVDHTLEIEGRVVSVPETSGGA
jgi:hypothetical protein